MPSTTLQYYYITMDVNDFSNYTILIVDDVYLNIVLVEKMLKRYNFNVKSATGGEQALEIVSEEKPSLILLDLMMPNMDGFEVLNILRKKPETKDIPVVILSALNSEADIKRGLDAGANGYITKPVIMSRLIEAVKAALGE